MKRLSSCWVLLALVSGAATKTATGAESPSTHGVAVVAGSTAADVAWPLAQKLYRDRSILPRGLEESVARVLAGETPPEGSAAKLADMRALRDSIHGDDAPSRLVLRDLCGRLSVKAIALVTHPPVEARAFDCVTANYLRAVYFPDDVSGHGWAGAAHALTLTYGAAPKKETRVAPGSNATEGRQFYKSWWFWGAIGGAAALGGTALIVASTGGSSQMEMQMHIPR